MKIDKFVCNIYNKNNHAVHVKTLKQALDYRLILEKVQKFNELNQVKWLKFCIDMSIELIKISKKWDLKGLP